MDARLNSSIFASFCVAWVAFGMGWWAVDCPRCNEQLLDSGNASFFESAVVASIAWVFQFWWSVLRHGRQALWLLVLAPFALFWPVYFALNWL